MDRYRKKGHRYRLTSYIKLISAICLSSLAISIWLSWSREENSASRTTRRFKPLINTPGCHIPDLDPFDESLRHFLSATKHPVTCNNVTPPLTYEDGEVLRFNRTALRLFYPDRMKYCEYQGIYKSNTKSDNLYVYSRESVQFDDDITIPTQFVRVTCYGESGDMIYANFHAFIIEDERLEMRCEEAFSKFLQRNKPKEQISVLVLGVDSVSRLNFIRQLPRTRRFLVEHMNAVEMRGFNKLADNTYVNVVPMLTGKFIEELSWQENSSMSFDEISFIWKNFSAAGYRTLFAEDAPKIAIFNYAKEGFYERPADYYLRPFSLALEDHGSMWKQDHDCVGDRLETELVLNYVSDFATTFNDRPYFAKAFITRLTHDNVNKAVSADRPYLEFFQRLHSEGHLDRTVVIFYSDHGMRFGAMRQTYIGKLEERLPFLFVAFPPWFASRYPQLSRNLHLNSHRLTTPFDIYETLRDLLPFTGIERANTIDKRGMSLLAEIPAERTCMHAGVSAHWCACHRHRATSTDDAHIRPAASHVVDFINLELRRYHGRCAWLRLNDTTDALKTPDNDGGVTYLIVLRTTPGEALFEATVRHVLADNKNSYNIIGDISRINQYGDQPKCIKYHKHKKFCFCR